MPYHIANTTEKIAYKRFWSWQAWLCHFQPMLTMTNVHQSTKANFSFIHQVPLKARNPSKNGKIKSEPTNTQDVQTKCITKIWSDHIYNHRSFCHSFSLSSDLVSFFFDGDQQDCVIFFRFFAWPTMLQCDQSNWLIKRNCSRGHRSTIAFEFFESGCHHAQSDWGRCFWPIAVLALIGRIRLQLDHRSPLSLMTISLKEKRD